MKDQSCKERIGESYRERMKEVRALWDLYHKDPEASHEDYGRWSEYGLCFDYVAPGTFNGQRRGYFRYQISWGGPSEEFRFFCDEGFNLVRCEFWFLDWGDGARRRVTGKNLEVWSEIWEDFRGMGAVEGEYQKAMEE